MSNPLLTLRLSAAGPRLLATLRDVFEAGEKDIREATKRARAVLNEFENVPDEAIGRTPFTSRAPRLPKPAQEKEASHG